jgi:hypothetical protein
MGVGEVCSLVVSVDDQLSGGPILHSPSVTVPGLIFCHCEKRGDEAISIRKI